MLLWSRSAFWLLWAATAHWKWWAVNAHAHNFPLPFRTWGVAVAIDAHKMTVSSGQGIAPFARACVCVQVLRGATGDPAEGTFLTDVRKQKIDKLLAEYVKRAPK